MNMVCRLLTAFSIILATSSLPAVAVELPASLSIALPSGTAKIGDDLLLRIKLTNVSNRPFTFNKIARSDTGEQVFLIQIASPDGRIEDQNSLYRNAPGIENLNSGTEDPRSERPILTSRCEATLSPGDSIQETSTISKAFDMSKPGRYWITASKEIPNGSGSWVSIISNTITVTLVK